MPDFADLSSNNSGINLTAYARGGARIIGLKATEGQTYHWPAHRALAAQAHTLGLAVYHYDFLRGPDEADEFLTEIGPVFLPEHGDRLVVDYEAAATPAMAIPVLRAVEAAHGPQVIYAGAAKITDTRLPYRPGWAWWQAAYTALRPAAPAGWPAPIAWQYTQTGRSAVAAGDVDLSHYYGPTPKPPVPVEDPHMPVFIRCTDPKHSGATFVLEEGVVISLAEGTDKAQYGPSAPMRTVSPGTFDQYARRVMLGSAAKTVKASK